MWALGGAVTLCLLALCVGTVLFANKTLVLLRVSEIVQLNESKSYKRRPES